MRKAMSKKVGAGGRFDVFLDSVMHAIEVPPAVHNSTALPSSVVN